MTGPVVVNTLRRLAAPARPAALDGPPAPARPAALDGPPAPALRLEPQADCGRYDSLREVRHAR